MRSCSVDAEARASEPADTLPGERAACAQRSKLEAHYRLRERPRGTSKRSALADLQ